jgi:queuine tRNA-ribosyltransferase
MINEPVPTALRLPSGEVRYPAYLPDATYGVVRSIDSRDLAESGLQAVMMNSFHLMQRPGSLTIQSMGGLHKMSGWRGPIFTDSGGFQAYSLIRQDPKFGVIQERGLSFKPEGSKRKFLLTPEKSVQLQISYAADVIICLDDCTHVDNDAEEQRVAVRRTVDWAARAKKEYLRIADQKNWTEETRPRIFAVIQGGGVEELRRECAAELLGIGFDGFGFGGWPLDAKGNLLAEILTLVRSLAPRRFPMHALGVGHPQNVADCCAMGYDLFDSAMPTRDARHGRLYVFGKPPAEIDFGADGRNGWLQYRYINDEKHIRADEPVSPYCDCHTCRNYSLGYLRHLFKLNDTLYQRLATIHNLRFMAQLSDLLRGKYYANG